MIDGKVTQVGALVVIVGFICSLFFDGFSADYEVPLPLYGLMGTILGGGVVLGLRRDDKKNNTPPDKSGDTGGS